MCVKIAAVPIFTEFFFKVCNTVKLAHLGRVKAIKGGWQERHRKLVSTLFFFCSILLIIYKYTVYTRTNKCYIICTHFHAECKKMYKVLL